MWWAKILATLTGQTVESVLKYKQAKVEAKWAIELAKLEGKHAYELAKTARAEASEGRDHEWEMMSIRNSGWKDEYVLIIMSIPMILSFIPFTQPFVVSGFLALDGTPLWYRTIVASIYLATFGLRLWRRDVRQGTDVVGMIK